jgi:prepilin-type N-terminal cleavage/methylation domain-containing protein
MKKTNNKGFSLVELIIVIAIMAILIGVLAPQYMKYVEKSRVSADKDVLDSVYNAMSTALSDPDVDPAAITYGTTAGSLGTAGTPSTGYTEEFWDTVYDTLGSSNGATDVQAKLKSKISKNNGSAIKYDCDAKGNFTVYVGTLNGPNDHTKTNAGITVGAGATN